MSKSGATNSYRDLSPENKSIYWFISVRPPTICHMTEILKVYKRLYSKQWIKQGWYRNLKQTYYMIIYKIQFADKSIIK